MLPLAPLSSRSWHAQLRLAFARRAARTVLAERRHDGPLVIQKPLYPEDEAVCHAIVVHPPGGIAGGDRLEICVRAGETAHALLTTPGAAKWYRSAGARAEQQITLRIGAGAFLEWLPQEAIFFGGALAELRMDVDLEADGAFIGWEILCLGRTGSGETFTDGECRARTLIQRDRKPLWLENARLAGGAPELDSPAILAGEPVAGTLTAASLRVTEELLRRCREIKAMSGVGAVTVMPGLLVGRYLGASSEAAKHYFIQLWRLLRPVLTGRPAVEPRIWRT